ncbi:MAG: DNA topoisomerase, partial [Pseudomonadota bacterium]|nr:DNA topoisomerase [Pseudomonadota bacterium]
TTRITTAHHEGVSHHFQSNGKVLLKPGWLAIYGKEADAEMDKKEGEQSKTLVPVKPGEMVRNEHVEARHLQTRPPARYSEATLLGAMEGAGKWIDDDELREAMQEKGLGTPATRAAIIEGLLTEKYLLREGRELIPTAKAFQLMTLLRGLQVEELSRPELTGDWEYKLAQMEKGQLSRDAFMREIAAMTERIVKKAKEYDRDTVPGDYATLAARCPQCGGVVKENYRRYACTGAQGNSEGCGFSFTKTPAGRTFAVDEAETFVRERRIGPLEGFRSKAGWPFVAELSLVKDEGDGHYKLEFDFGDDARAEASGEAVDLSDQPSLGACPKCGAPVKAFGKNYVCENAVPTAAQATPSCDFKSGQVILQQPVAPEQMHKLLQEGKTDVLDKFVSNRTRRTFKARLAWSADEGKVIFEFEPREGARPYPQRTAPAGKTAGKTATKKVASAARGTGAAARKAMQKTAAAKTPRTGSLKPSPALAAVIGEGPFGRGEVMKKLWDYIKAHKLQDPQDKRTIVADDKLRPIFGADSVGMFKLAGIVGGHLT